ncbi:ATP-binding protein [Thiorhodococcus fuscus]|uniref:histidine kinase n=1 Tax=Thiorhodococcus fuscus TaxID=527200 RepID=A0ABW4YBT5_9GAMM
MLSRFDTLAGRTLQLLVGMTLLTILGSAFILQDERKDRFEERNLAYLLDEVTTLVWLLQDASPVERARIIERFSRTGDEIAITPEPSLALDRPWRHAVEHVIHHKLRSALGIEDRESLRVRVEIADHRQDRDEDEERRGSPPEHPRALGDDLRSDDVRAILVCVRLRDGRWVDFRTTRIDEPPPWAGKTLQLLALLLTTVIGGGLLMARRAARPMAQLAEAAQRLGLGEDVEPIPESGPREVRETIRAFNRMQDRLHRHIQDRLRLLAAVSHDLRTPITTLRLRAEYIEDADMRDKTLATLGEMEAILSATLSFARDEAADETARATDLAALAQSLVDDHADLGGDVGYAGPERLIVRCRPVALKRALSNLIDNAVKYGGSVQVSLATEDGQYLIRVDDAGPGIPEADLEKVFAPFFRLEVSRSRETGGTGLGLSVARTIVHAHGGTLVLINRPEGGLSAQIRLPESIANGSAPGAQGRVSARV